MSDWTHIVKRGFESKDLDYKAAKSWDESDKKACCELVKDILAISNTNGGWLVIGVNETASGFTYSGVTQEQAGTFDTTRLNRFLQNYTDPPINTHIQKPNVEGTIFIVIEVPRFVDTPHICQKDFPDVLRQSAIYVRTDNNESAELKKSADVRNIVERTIKNRADTLLESFRSILKHGLGSETPSDNEEYRRQIDIIRQRSDELNTIVDKSCGYREVIFHPCSYNPSRFDIGTLKEMAKYASIDFRGWPFLFLSKAGDFTSVINDGYETHIGGTSPITGNDDFHFWQLKQSGLLYTKDLLYEDELNAKKQGQRILDFDGFSMNTAEAITCLTRLYERWIDDADDITLTYRLNGMNGRAMGSLNPHRGMHILPACYFCRIDDITYQAKKTFAEWRAGVVDHSLEICKYVFERFNWTDANLSESRKLIVNMLERKL